MVIRIIITLIFERSETVSFEKYVQKVILWLLIAPTVTLGRMRGKLARTVLRRGGHSNVIPLSDLSDRLGSLGPNSKYSTADFPATYPVTAPRVKPALAG